MMSDPPTLQAMYRALQAVEALLEDPRAVDRLAVLELVRQTLADVEAARGPPFNRCNHERHERTV